MSSTVYSKDFFDRQIVGSMKSAEVVVPMVLEMVHPNRVIDVGCGRGAWLSVFNTCGVNVLGCDGQYIDRASLLIPQKCFRAVDLSKPSAVRELGRFDLCLSLEVAEHLDCRVAKEFVSTLTELSPIVLFSAAVPFQGGNHHVNEQWPRYWADLFAAHDYAWLDPFRKKMWNDKRIEWWYRQNMFLFVATQAMKPEWEHHRTSAQELQLISPDILHEMLRPKALIKELQNKLWAKIRRPT